MTRRASLLPVLFAGLFALSVAADEKADAAKSKKALQEIGEFIGQWNLDAKPAKGPSWKETPTFGFVGRQAGDTGDGLLELLGGAWDTLKGHGHGRRPPVEHSPLRGPELTMSG